MIQKTHLYLFGVWFLLGAGFCAAMSRPDVFAGCASAGCRVVEGMTVWGFSPWLLGSIGYGWLAFLCFVAPFRWKAGKPGFSPLLTMSLIAGLCVDGLFLLAMLGMLRVACMLCLFAGAFLMASLLLLDTTKWHALILLGWFVLFILCTGLLAGTSAGSPSEGIEIWFSPSCPACVETISQYEGKPGVVLHPVAKDDRDKELLSWMDSGIREGLRPSQALKYAYSRVGKAEPPVPSFAFSRRLLRNKAFVAQNGGVLPLVVFHGAPITGYDNDTPPLIGGNCGSGDTPCEGRQ